MRRIEQITDDAKQKHTIVTEGGEQFTFSLLYSQQQYGWFITELVYNDLIIRGLRLVNSPNILHQFRNQLPFGIAIFGTNEREPYFKQDFTSGANTFFILNPSEVEEFARFISGEV